MSGCLEHTLHYSSPGHGDWGVVRVGMLAPESVQLFVCPAACGRHGALGAMKQGFKNRLFYLYVTQSDIIEGYDPLIPDAVDEVLAALSVEPRVFFVFVSCLDDLVGTDHEALLALLFERHPKIQFRIGRMNPISLGSKTPPPVSIQNNLYSLLEPADGQDDGINSFGNLDRIADSSELYAFTRACGAKEFRHISQYQTLAAYQDMAKSRANLVLLPSGLQAARQVRERLGIPFLFVPITYDPEEIAADYRRMWEFLMPEEEWNGFPGLLEARKEAEEEIQRARERIGSLPIIVDASAVTQPFGLAKMLINYGFHVVRVEAQECASFDKEHLEWLLKEHPEVEFSQPEHHRAVLFDRRIEESLAIGVEGAYLSGSRYVADLFNDEGMFGYDGVKRLMRLLTEAVKVPTDLKALINDYGLVI